MDHLITILMVTIPPVIVAVTAYLLIKRFLDSEEKRQLVELQKMNRGKITPLRMQAYERLVLYLERMHPSNLVMRTHQAGMSARLLHSEMLKSIRDEYGHNMSQQIYVSAEAWKMSNQAKEETIKLLNIAFQNVGDTADSIKLGEVVFELVAKVETLPSEIALEFTKKEVQKLF